MKSNIIIIEHFVEKYAVSSRMTMVNANPCIMMANDHCYLYCMYVHMYVYTYFAETDTSFFINHHHHRHHHTIISCCTYNSIITLSAFC